jgi:hypothetical protein
MEGLQHLLQTQRHVSAQAEPLVDVKTVEQYIDWMKGTSVNPFTTGMTDGARVETGEV